MSRMIVDIQLFFSSYAPLFVMLGLRFQSTPLRIICFMIGAGGALCLLLILWQIRRGAPKRYRIERVEDRGDDVAGYLVTYLLPFLTIAEPSAGDIAAYAVFIAIVGVVYVRTGLIYVNPLLYVMGFRLFSVTASPGLDAMLIAKKQPVAGQEVWVSRFRSHLFVGAAPP